MHLTDWVGILKMSRIQFMDLDTSSEGVNAGSGVVISKQIETGQESKDVDNKHRKTDVIQQNDQQQEIEETEQVIARQIDQRDKTSNNENKITDMDKNFEGSTKDTNFATQYTTEQETGEEEQDLVGKDEQLDDKCQKAATLAQRNIALDEGKEKCANLQHVVNKDQENLTPTENEPTHPEVVEREKVEKHENVIARSTLTAGVVCQIKC